MARLEDLSGQIPMRTCCHFIDFLTILILRLIASLMQFLFIVHTKLLSMKGVEGLKGVLVVQGVRGSHGTSTIVESGSTMMGLL